MMKEDRALVIGVTGGIASGKTTVSRVFERFGAEVIDADQLSREMVENDPAILDRLVASFGREILREDGSLDRRKLGRVVFGNRENLEKLNRTIHPPILAELTRRMEEAKGSGKAVVIDAALLVECDFLSPLDKLVLVVTDREKQVERLVERVGLSEVEAQQRIDSQLGAEEKQGFADYIIYNNGSLEELEQRAEELWGRMIGGCQRTAQRGCSRPE